MYRPLEQAVFVWNGIGVIFAVLGAVIAGHRLIARRQQGNRRLGWIAVILGCLGFIFWGIAKFIYDTVVVDVYWGGTSSPPAPPPKELDVLDHYSLYFFPALMQAIGSFLMGAWVFVLCWLYKSDQRNPIPGYEGVADDGPT